MKQYSNIFYSIILVGGDFLALVSAFVLAYIMRVKYDTRPLLEQIPSEAYLYGFLTVLPLWIVVNAFIGLYSKNIYDNRFKELGRLIIGSFLGILVVVGYDFVSEKTLFPARLVVVYGLILSFSFLVIFRVLARVIRTLLYRSGFGVRNVLIVGDNPAAESIFSELSNTNRSGHYIIGVVSRKSSAFYETFPSFITAIKKIGVSKIHSIIQVELYKQSEKNDEIMNFAQTNHISYRFIPGNNELFVGNIEVELYRGTPVVAVHQTPLVGWGNLAKNIFDFILAIFLLIVLSPIFLITSIIMKTLNPKETLFFSQKRLTRHNQEFTVYKFRSQYQKFDNTTPEKAFQMISKPELAKQYRENGDYLRNDPRILKGGKLIRTLSIDEMPQLFNVIKGNISMVGPRALIAEELNSYQKKHHILSIKSGITGLAQVSGRRNIGFDERRKLDLYYVQNWSFWLDIMILLRTLRAVINGIGAK